MNAVLRERFERLGVLHAKLGAEYVALAKECGDNAERTEDAPTAHESSGDAATESVG